MLIFFNKVRHILKEYLCTESIIDWLFDALISMPQCNMANAIFNLYNKRP